MKSLPKNYNHKEAEPRLQRGWEETRVYAWDESQPRENTFVIDTPPPTVSGVLHMGHIFSYAQADFVARYQRMSGKTVFYPMGFDDNGLPTERLVEKEKKVRGSAMPREEFVSLCREVVKGAEDEFRRLFKSVALSVDWTQEYQTISDEVRRLSQLSFLDLLQKGEAYRDFRPTYWDWVDQTAIAQAEIENKEMPGIMNEIAFTLEGGGKLVIATTRPELLGGCVAVMYHPEDPKAESYKNKYATTPLFGVKVPMIADELVERDKGTGLVMCCTFGDDTDKEWQRKYALPSRALLREDGRLAAWEIRDIGRGEQLFFTKSSQMPKDDPGTALRQSHLWRGNCADIVTTLRAFETAYGEQGETERQYRKLKPAREKIIAMLAAQGTLAKQTNITHTVKCAERSGTPIEIVPTYQWFVKVTDKKQALKAKGDQCNWYPEFMHIRLNQWIDGLKEDWCISRQRFFGVPFPVWYSKRAGEEGRLLFADTSQLPVDPLTDLPSGYTRDEVAGDRDVMDTWATSSVSPQINARGISGNGSGFDRFSRLFPADLRPQAHEIIRTWAFYTIVKAHLHEDSIPWHNLMISGWCLASDKTKMSKSKGNVVTPVDLIIDKGADVVRYWASTSRLGADTAFSEDLLKIGKKLVTKLWNATAFASIHLSKIDTAPGTAAEDVAAGRVSEALDKWILSRLHKTIAKATQEFTRFEYCDARVAVEEFFWKDFCDNYLELVKARAYGEIGAPQAQVSAHLTLHHCLGAILRLFAPFVPHVAEELFSHIFEGQGSVHARGTWPQAVDYPVDEEIEKAGSICVKALNAVRKQKSERNVSIKFPILLLKIEKWTELPLAHFISDLKAAGNITDIQFNVSLPDVRTTKDDIHCNITWGEQADVA